MADVWLGLGTEKMWLRKKDFGYLYPQTYLGRIKK